MEYVDRWILRVRFSGIISEIRENTGIHPKQATDDLIQMILGNNLADYDKHMGSEIDTMVINFLKPRKSRLWEVFQEVGVGIHQLNRNIQTLFDRHIFRNGIVFIQTVFLVVSIVNIGYSAEILCLKSGILTS